MKLENKRVMRDSWMPENNQNFLVQPGGMSLDSASNFMLTSGYQPSKTFAYSAVTNS